MLEHNIFPIRGMRPIQPPVQTNVREEFLTHALVGTVADIISHPEDVVFVLLAKIDNVMLRGRWWYAECDDCQINFYPKSDMFCYENCSMCIGRPTLRYRISLRVIDQFARAVFAVSDKDVTRLLGISCFELLTRMNLQGLNNGIPAAFEGLIGHEVLFKVAMRRHRTNRFAGNCNVISLTDDADIIEAFKLKYPHLAGIRDAGKEPPIAFDVVAQDVIAQFGGTPSEDVVGGVNEMNSDGGARRIKWNLEVGQTSGVNKLTLLPE